MEQQNQPVWQQYMPDHVNLYYVDYDSNLNKECDLLQQCVAKNCLIPLSERVYDFWDYPEEYYLNEIREKMEADDLEGKYEEYEDDIREWLLEHDKSNPEQELLDNTSSQTFFYSLGIELDHGYHTAFMASPWRNQSCAQSAYRIRQALGIKKGTPEADAIFELCENSSYGGELRIYFEADIREMISGNQWAGAKFKNDWKTIQFNGTFAIAVWDNCNGDGDYIKIDIDRKFPFIRENLQISEAAEKYNIEYACGLCDDWLRDCCAPQLSFDNTKRGSVKKSKAIAQEQKFQKLFDEGKCSPLDNNIERHRDVYYRTSIPCGHYCPHCGKTWLD